MSLTSSVTFDVVDQTAQSASTSVVIQPPVGAGTGRGRLIHPTLGTLDYPHTPNETINVDGGPLYRPLWAHAATLGGAVDALWSGKLRDARVVERWTMGEVGCTLAFLRALWSFFATPPDPSAAAVVWCPSYTTTGTWNVVLLDVRAGGQEYTLDLRLASYGYAPQPVELEMRVLSAS